MAEEETAAWAELIYRSQHKRNIAQVLLAEKKIFVLWGREEDLTQSPPFPAGQGWISSSLAMCAEALCWQGTGSAGEAPVPCWSESRTITHCEVAEDGQEQQRAHCTKAPERALTEPAPSSAC